MHTFQLDPGFFSAYANRSADFGPLGLLAYARTYSRPLPEGGQERWADTCRRVVNGVYSFQRNHCLANARPWSDTKAQRSAQRMFAKMFDMKFTPPGRGLWSMGTDFLYTRGITAAMNCGFVSTADGTLADTITLLMNLLMFGVGVGSDVRGAGRWHIVQPSVNGDEVFVVEDSREGWAEAVHRMLTAYTGGAPLPSSWDLSLIRPAGAPIHGFGGMACGPGPLAELLEKLEVILRPAVGRALGTREIADIVNLVGVCVVAGGIRRSAEILLGRHDDIDFLELKSKALREERPWFWASNNTIIADEVTDFEPFAARVAEAGEPGLLFLDTCRKYGRLSDKANWLDAGAVGTNPCSEQTLWDRELCCLVETYLTRHRTLAEFLDTLKVAYLYAKTVTLVPTGFAEVDAIMMQNRRIGTSIAGALPAMEHLGKPEFIRWLRTGYDHVQRLDALYSKWLGVPLSVKTTSVKPGGTTPLLPGVAPGVHADHAPHYLRRVVVEGTSPLVDVYRRHGYDVEPSVYTTRSEVISIPVASDAKRFKRDYTIEDQIKFNALVQAHWSDNQVSQTIDFRPEEAHLIAPLVAKYRHQVKSLSFLPLIEGGAYEQMPYEQITAARFAELSSEIRPVREADLAGFTSHDTDERFCDSDSCLLPTP